MQIYPLEHPIELSSKKTITELKFKPHATAIDYVSFDTPGRNRQSILLISSLTGIDESIIEKLHRVDFFEADKRAFRIAYPELYGSDGELLVLSVKETQAVIEKKDSAS